MRFIAREPAEELERLKAYRDGIEKMEVAKQKADDALVSFRVSDAMPFQGQFLSDIAKHSKTALVKTRPTSDTVPVKKTKLQLNSFGVSGSAPSLHEVSVFADLMMQVPRAAIVGFDFRADMGRGEESGDIVSVGFKMSFVRVELADGRVK